MATKQLQLQEVVQRIKNSGAKRVRVAVSDIDGILRGKFMHTEKFLSALEGGFGFCNVVFGWDCADVCYEDMNIAYTGWHSGYPDAQAVIDTATYREIPWDDNVPFLLADFVNEDGEPMEVCPRQVLKRVIATARQVGFRPLFGLEFEWFNFQETPQTLDQKQFQEMTLLTPGMFGYSILRSSAQGEYFKTIMEDMGAFGVPIEGLHTETGPGVYEAAIAYSDALEAADRAILFKTGVKEIAYRFGIVPTFMAKWNATLPGCSGHMHQSLYDLETGKNVFYSEKGDYRMSPVFESYLAGQILGLTELLPFYAPTVNSYKRLVKGLWAPTHVTWGVDNRTPALRVIPGSANSTRLETRISGADINPYLAVAAALASGLHGVRKRLKLKDLPVQGNAYTQDGARPLPANLLEATNQMQQSELAKELFGEQFIDHFAKTRIWEWERFQRAVTDWELKRYMEII